MNHSKGKFVTVRRNPYSITCVHVDLLLPFTPEMHHSASLSGSQGSTPFTEHSSIAQSCDLLPSNKRGATRGTKRTRSDEVMTRSSIREGKSGKRSKSESGGSSKKVSPSVRCFSELWFYYLDLFMKGRSDRKTSKSIVSAFLILKISNLFQFLTNLLLNKLLINIMLKFTFLYLTFFSPPQL